MESGNKLKRLYCGILVFMIACITSVILPGSERTCFAGGINGNEARVLGVARGSFEYNGETYVAKQEYVDQLIAKLSGDDVNLTAEQADSAISQIYANVAVGVESGYIVKINSPEDNLIKDEKDEITEVAPDEKVVEKEPDNDKTTVKDNGNGTITVEDNEGKVIFEFDGILKNTGFSMKNTITIVIIIGVLLLCVVVCSVKDIIVIRRK